MFATSANSTMRLTAGLLWRPMRPSARWPERIQATRQRQSQSPQGRRVSRATTGCCPSARAAGFVGSRRRIWPSAQSPRSTFPCPRLRLGDLLARHAGGDILAGLAGILVAGRGGKVEPHVRGYVVLRHALTSSVHLPEDSLGVGVGLARRPGETTGRLAASCSTPRPVAYLAPRVYWASASPCAAARRNHRVASAASCGTPRPVAYLDQGVELGSRSTAA